MYDGLRRAHFNLFENVSHEDYNRLFDQMSAEVVSPESTAQVAQRLQRFAAFGRIAHARVDASTEAFSRHRAAGGRYLPLLLRFESRRAYVLENRSGEEGPPHGAEILTLEGEAIGTWFDRTRRHISADTDYLAAALLEYDFPGLVWLEVGSRPTFTVTYRHRGDLRTVALPARTQSEQRASRAPRADEGRSFRLLSPSVGFLRPGPFYNDAEGAADPYDNRAFVAFIDGAMTSLINQGAQSIIVDLRGNPGGDHSFSDHLLTWFATRPFRFTSDFRIRVSPETTASNAARLGTSANPATSLSRRLASLYSQASDGGTVEFEVPLTAPTRARRYRGRMYLLVDRHSFSNSVNVAAIVQDYRFGTVVGEETADLATTLGAMETFRLPRTGIMVAYPKAQIVRPSGSLVRRGVVPDIIIPAPREADASDPVLRRVVALAEADPR
jgi:hypothetical protein